MVYETPRGHDDLAAQTAQLEREQIERERAELAEAHALVRERRAQRPPVSPVPIPGADAIPGAVGLAEPAPAEVVSAPAVIDPAGREFERDEHGELVRDGRGEPIPVGEYDRDEHGRVVLDDDGNPYPVWPHETVDLHGRTVQVRVPQPAALQAFSMAVSKFTPVKTQNDMVALFVRRHISDRSYNELLMAMMDPDDSFTMEHFGDLMRKIATLGTARPTGPSRP